VPDTVHLQRVLDEVIPAAQDALPRVAWTGAELRRYRSRLYVMPPLPAHDASQVFEASAAARWRRPAGASRPGWGDGAGSSFSRLRDGALSAGGGALPAGGVSPHPKAEEAVAGAGDPSLAAGEDSTPLSRGRAGRGRRSLRLRAVSRPGWRAGSAYRVAAAAVSQGAFSSSRTSLMKRMKGKVRLRLLLWKSLMIVPLGNPIRSPGFRSCSGPASHTSTPSSIRTLR